jgi:hypothetical protein
MRTWLHPLLSSSNLRKDPVFRRLCAMALFVTALPLSSDAQEKTSITPQGKKEAVATEETPEATQDEGWVSPDELRKKVLAAFDSPPEECKPLHRDDRIWIQRDEQIVLLDGYIVQRKVPLELFACPVGSKEHEAIVAVLARARIAHAGLLAINAKPGSPASFEPFKPATGTTIRVYVLWLDKDNKVQGTLAQNWIRRMDNKKAMPWDFVFAGSKTYQDDEGKTHYLGDSGELVSVSNFTSSTIDVAVQSDQTNANLLFEAFTERIPKRHTPVRMVFSLTAEPPFGTRTEDKESKDKEPEHLTEKVPERILKYLAPKAK